MTAAVWPQPPNARAPLLSAYGVAVAASFALILSWPMLFVTAPLGYFDTMGYLHTGEQVVDLVISTIGASPPDTIAGAEGSAADHADSTRQLRSFVYSVFLYLGSLGPGGLVIATLAQTTATLLVAFAFFTVRPPVVTALVGAGFLASITTLPWFASYAMPDILAAAVILFYALLASGIARIGIGWRIVLCAIAVFSVISHYGHIPLAFGLMISALAASAIRRTLSTPVLLLAVLPVVLAVGLNLTVSTVALGEPSVAPKRLPILLARSIDDGPAGWYLRDACPDVGHAICGIFPKGVPDDMFSFLWSQEGIAGTSAEEMNAIRAEEGTILWNTLLTYPAEQLKSFFGNTFRQLVTIGTEQVNPLVWLDDLGNFVAHEGMRNAYPYLAHFDVVTVWGTLFATAAAVLAWAANALPRGAGWALSICIIGLFGNALIFGGLSVPADRYQSRVVWVLPALALVYWLNQHGRLAKKEADYS